MRLKRDQMVNQQFLSTMTLPWCGPLLICSEGVLYPCKNQLFHTYQGSLGRIWGDGVGDLRSDKYSKVSK
jgi:hypothetical protein